MLGSIISLFFAVPLAILGGSSNMTFDMNSFRSIMAALGLGLVFAVPFFFAAVSGALARSGEKLSPRLLKLFAKDRRIKGFVSWLLAFALLNLGLSFVTVTISEVASHFLIALWIFLLGISIDSAFHLIRRIQSYLNPFDVVALFTAKAEEDIREEREMDLCSEIEVLAEIGVKSVDKQSSSLTTHILDELNEVMKIFLDSSKSISHRHPDRETEELGIKDKVSFTLFYFFQRIETIFQKAVSVENETVCSHLIQTLGKVAFYAAQYDITLAGYPLFYLGKCLKRAMKKELHDVRDRAACTLEEVAKAILADIDLSFLEIQDLFAGIITYLDEIEKDTFRHNKSVLIDSLMRPFLNLKELFSTEKMAKHQDTVVILQRINRVLGEFEALKLVMQTLPPQVKKPEEEGSEQS